jgi:peptidoglycan/LPS O-acetylase OafA/YrhL
LEDTPPQRKHRTDIQGIRALAVGMVLVFHLWPERLPGGFTGVDIFFVVSGYLMTDLILRRSRTMTPARLT